MGKLFSAVKNNYDELAKFQDQQEKNYFVETTYDNIVKYNTKTKYLNYFINEIQNNSKYYFGSEDNFKAFLEQNKELFPNSSIPKALYDGNTVMIDVKGVNYEKILDTLEGKIGEGKTNELLEKYKSFKPVEPKREYPFKEYNTGIINGLDELNIDETKLKEFKDALNYAADELVVKKTEDETDKIIDNINRVREKEAKTALRNVSAEVGADVEKVTKIAGVWDAITFRVDEKSEKLTLVPFLDEKIQLTNEYKNKVLELDKFVTDKGLIPNGAVGETGFKEYGYLDYFNKTAELKDALLAYGKLTDKDERIQALENISLKANELKDITAKYEDVLSFIKDNFDTSKISLNANLYSGRKHDDSPDLESFRQNLPRRWDQENVAPGIVLSGYAQLKGLTKLVGVSVEEFLDNPNKYYLMGAKKITSEIDEKYLIPSKDINDNPIPLGKRMAHALIQDAQDYAGALEGYKIANRGIEFLNHTSEFNENTIKNIAVSAASNSLAAMYNHSSFTLFNKEAEADYESLQNLFALGNDTDNLFALSLNYFHEGGHIANVDEAYKLKIEVMNNVNPANETRRVMGVIRDYMAERKLMYIERRNDNSTDIELEEGISPAQMLVAGKQYLNDFIYKNNINLLDFNKEQRKEVMDFLNDPVKTFMEKYLPDENLLRTNYKGELLETVDEIDKEFSSEFGRLYKKNGENFVRAFNDLNTQTKGRNAGKSITQIIEANKGGYFERKFSSSSKEYKALVTAVEAATDPKSPTFGDLNGAKFYAQKYVDHKLPQGANFEKLSENEKRRVEFCHTILGASLQMELNQKMEDEKIKLAPDNAQFQEGLKKDVDLDLENNNNIIAEENVIENENVKTQ